jgi:hypothetical protein
MMSSMHQMKLSPLIGIERPESKMARDGLRAKFFAALVKQSIDPLQLFPQQQCQLRAR